MLSFPRPPLPAPRPPRPPRPPPRPALLLLLLWLFPRPPPRPAPRPGPRPVADPPRPAVFWMLVRAGIPPGFWFCRDAALGSVQRQASTISNREGSKSKCKTRPNNHVSTQYFGDISKLWSLSLDSSNKLIDPIPVDHARTHDLPCHRLSGQLFLAPFPACAAAAAAAAAWEIPP